MNTTKKLPLILTFASLFSSQLLFSQTQSGENTFEKFNSDWLFTETDSPDYRLTTYDPASWRELNLPHDWSIEHSFSKDLEGCTAFMPGGIGWYSKKFDTTIDKNQKAYIIFDGVYNNAEFWINGIKIGEHPFGYAPIYYDLTSLLAPKGEENRLSVRVDHSRYADSRWYTGSGIYRDVHIVVTDKLHIPVWGTYITTPEVSSKSAIVDINVDVKNEYDAPKNGVVVSDIFNSKGEKVATASASFSLKAGESITTNDSVEIENPELWGVDSPALYTVKSRVVADNKTIDQRETKIGIRSFYFDKDKGFYLNGENMKIKGVCLHHDAGLVGCAVPRDVWKRRLLALKDMGSNAIRTSHNPVSDEFLELCDELGFLVQHEFYDEWDLPKDKRYNMQDKEVDYITRGHSENFQEWAEIDLKNTMLSSRNHPSIFQWSIGNEIEWTYPGNRTATGLFGNTNKNGKMDWTLWRVPTPPNTPEQVREFWASYPEQTFDMGQTAKKLAEWTREMDTTRPVTANLILPSSSMETDYAKVLDIIGFSYKETKYDYFKENYPDKPMMGTENVARWYEWKAVLDHDFIPGIFLWTGIDYMGECRENSWPSKQSSCAPLDVAAFPRGAFYAFKSYWSNEPVLAIYTQTQELSTFKKDSDGKAIEKSVGGWKLAPRPWQNVNPYWNYIDGQPTIVEVYSNCSEVELFQNGKSLGKQYLVDQDDSIYKWAVDYKDGKIEARGVKDGVKVVESLETLGSATSISLSADRESMEANECDVLHVVAQLVDSKGRAIKNQEENITFEIEGEYHFLGTDCGITAKFDTFKNRTMVTNLGRCLLAVQSTDKSGTITVKAKNSDGKLISSNTINVNVTE